MVADFAWGIGELCIKIKNILEWMQLLDGICIKIENKLK